MAVYSSRLGVLDSRVYFPARPVGCLWNGLAGPAFKTVASVVAYAGSVVGRGAAAVLRLVAEAARPSDDHGSVLRFLPFQADRDVVLAALRRPGFAASSLPFVASEIRTDPEIVRRAEPQAALPSRNPANPRC